MESQASNAGQVEGVEGSHSDPASFIHRTRESLWKKSPQLQKALQLVSSELVLWMQKGKPWRAFLVSTVGTVLLLGLAGFGAFMLFFLAATLNAVAIGFLASIVSVGVFTALFFGSLAAIYIGALIIAVIFISMITFFCICAALTAAGWVAFLWVIWQVLKKGAELLKGFLGVSSLKLSSATCNGEKYYESHHEKPYY